jgi:diguanylate cyclase (GGDEF)-like protein
VLGRRTERLQEAYRQAIAGRPVELDVEYRGRIHWVHAAPVFDEGGAVAAGLSISIDVTEQRRTEADMRRRARGQSALAVLGRHALDGASEGRLLTEGADAVAATLGVDTVSVITLDEGGGHLVLRAGAGWPREVIRQTRIPITDAHRRALAALQAGPEILLDASQRDPDGPLIAAMGVASMITVLIGRGDRPYGSLSAFSFSPRHFTAEDADFLQTMANVLWSAIDRADVDEELLRSALYDELTELPNRRLFEQRLELALLRAQREHCGVAVVLLDLDNFKVINDSLGHHGGDELLRALTPRLLGVARDGDTVARLGGDEFALVCEGIVSEEHALALANRIVAALADPIELGRRRHAVKASIGIVVDDGRSAPGLLLRDADTAMHRAKERGGGCVERFCTSMRERVVARMRTESELYGAIERDELRVFFQPFYSIPDRRLLGMEALVRWQHPQRGLVLPGEFIPLAEQNGQIVELGQWVLDTAARALAGWRSALAGSDALMLSVNVSARQLLPASGSLHSLPDAVTSVLSAAELPPQLLALEITESMLMEEADEPESVLLELKRLGVQIMLDDFGTGHSSLGRLGDFPLDVLKVDRRFVRGLGQNGGREPIVTAIIAMARALDLRVIAEGVETDDEWESLVALGCEAAQGYALARPMPPEQLAELLAGSASAQAA